MASYMVYWILYGITGGLWTVSEQNLHRFLILESIAAHFGLKCFVKALKKCNIVQHIVAITAISHFNRWEDQYSHLHNTAKTI